MVKYKQTKVKCPHSFQGKPNTVEIRYIEDNGNIVIAQSNGCNNASGSPHCLHCIRVTTDDFKNGKLKDTYYFQ